MKSKLIYLSLFAALSTQLPTATSFAAEAAPAAAKKPSSDSGITKKDKLEFAPVTNAQRLEYIKKSTLWLKDNEINIPGVNFRSGPFAKMKYMPEEVVTCSYITQEEALGGKKKPSGNTPKFACRDIKGKKLKIKYGADNGEVYGEVAATWVMTAIGAYADKMYPIRLNCADCPSDPFHNEQDRGQWVAGTKVATEDKLGERIETAPDSGIAFNEFHLIEDRVGAEALVGLAAFLGHGDNKAPNQSLSCRPQDTVIKASTNEVICNKPLVYMQDVGATFGGAGAFTKNETAKMNLKSWQKEPVWDDAQNCILHLESSAKGSLKGEDKSGRLVKQIGEQARKFLVSRLGQLTREQLVDMFNAARAPERKPSFTAEQWADAFLKKVEELRNPPVGKGKTFTGCPHDVVPVNSAPKPKQ